MHRYTPLQLALIARQRSALLQLRDQQRVDAIVLRQILAGSDGEELRRSGDLRSEQAAAAGAGLVVRLPALSP